jgi:hypothetical protein
LASPDQAQPPDYLGILTLLTARSIHFVVIGGIGALLQGVPLLSFDVDVVPEPSDENLTRLSKALVEMQSEVLYAGRVIDLEDGEWLRAAATWNFSTSRGRFDILFAPHGVASYSSLAAASSWIEIGPNLVVSVASVNDLIAMKESANRQKDQQALEILRWLRDRDQPPP